MKNTQSIYTIKVLLVGLLLMLGCDTRDIDELQPISFPNTPEVFIDDFTGDLAYAAFGGSDVTAFQIETQETYNGSPRSMRFSVPDTDSPNGAFAGGVFFSRTGRNLSGYNALTFYIKASQPANIAEIGFGNDLGENKYVVNLTNAPVNTNWQKVVIPIPDASKLVGEKGLLYYSAGAENGRGYTFWIDEVRFEKLPNLGAVTGVILTGQNQVIDDAETGQNLILGGLQASVNLPNGVSQVVNISPYYFTFNSSNPAIAGVNDKGEVLVVDAGTTTITANLGETAAIGSLEITSVGDPVGPETAAPTPPTRNPSDVISLYSNAYTNVPVNTWNARYLFSTVDEFFVQVAGDDVIRYRNLNFVGIEFLSPPVNASGMTTLHLDIWTPDPTNLPNNFKVLLADVGVDGAFGGNNDSNHEITFTSPRISTSNWVSLDIPLSSFTGLNSRANLAQMVLSGSLPNVYMDNVYFYRNPVTPLTAAPVPTKPASEVLSIFSDTYINVAGTDFNPPWEQSTVVTQTPIAGNNTLHYANFNYQGVLVGGAGNSINVSTYGFIHIDYYSANGSALNFFLIGTNGVEKSSSLTLPTSGWSSADIPLSAFSGVDLSAIKEFKSDGGSGGDVYLDNIYFYGTAGGGGGSGNCPAPPAGEFIVDGGFEINAGCWELIVNQGNTSVTIVSDVNNGGTNSARIETAPAANPAIKQTRFGVGSILPNTTYVVKFDIRQDAADPVADGAVLKVATFSEAAEGSGIGAVRHELIGAEGSVPSTWTPRTLTFTTPANATNVAGGLSLLIELVGGGPPTTGTIYIDNVSLRAQ